MDKEKKQELKDQEKIEELERVVQQGGSEEETEAQEPSLEEKIEVLENENANLQDKLLRIAAEFENFRRRSATEKSDWIKNANQRIILEICDVNDNFERAFQTGSLDMESYQKGIEMIHKQISAILKREGVEKIEVEKKGFDPVYHEALAHIPSELEENQIAAVIQNGYIMNGKVIRAARVAVSNGEKPQTEDSGKKKKKK